MVSWQHLQVPVYDTAVWPGLCIQLAGSSRYLISQCFRRDQMPKKCEVMGLKDTQQP